MEAFNIDVSGGEPLLFRENVGIIKKLSRRFGRDNISITATGRGLALVNKDTLKDIIGEERIFWKEEQIYFRNYLGGTIK